MSKSLLLLAGGIIAVLVIASILFLPISTDDGFEFSFHVVGEDENGNPVDVPMSWWIAGIEVTSIRPTLTWSVTGDGVDWATLIIDGDMEIFRLDYTGQTETDITPAYLGFQVTGVDAKDGSRYSSLVCDSLLSGVAVSGIDADNNNYWNIKLRGTISGSASQTGNFGDPVTDKLVIDLTFTLKWVDGSIIIGGGINR